MRAVRRPSFKKPISLVILPLRAQASRRCETQAPLSSRFLSEIEDTLDLGGAAIPVCVEALVSCSHVEKNKNTRFRFPDYA